MNNKKKIIKEALLKFPDLPTRAISRYIQYNNGDLFGNDLERIRGLVRYYRGSYGKAQRHCRIVDYKGSIAIPPTWRMTRTSYNLKPGLWLIISDIHIPFHEPIPLETTIKYAQLQKVTGVLLNGDAQDCASVSFWPSARKRDFDKEIVMFIDFLNWLQYELPDAEFIYKPGNHEYRLPRLFQSKVPDLLGLPFAVVETVLHLEERNIEYLDYQQIVNAGKLPILHGHEIKGMSQAVNPARGLFLKAKSTALCGHFHSTSEHSAKTLLVKAIATWSTGCLCDLNPEYNPYGNNWNWGFALVHVEKDGMFEVENRRILPNGTIA